jgi:hypothetical protein
MQSKLSKATGSDTTTSRKIDTKFNDEGVKRREALQRTAKDEDNKEVQKYWCYLDNLADRVITEV